MESLASQAVNNPRFASDKRCRRRISNNSPKHNELLRASCEAVQLEATNESHWDKAVMGKTSLSFQEVTSKSIVLRTRCQ